jgi:hypothetical protein
MLVVPFAMWNGSNEHFAKTNRPLACCLQNRPGGPILLGARARAERAYQDWKWAVDEMWEHERHRLQTAACQCHIDKQAARKQQEAAHRQRLLDEHAANERQEANRRQRLLDKHAAYKCQEAVRRQRLLNEETAHPQRLLDKEAACRLMAKRAALARQMAAAQTIFLWLRRCRLHIRLVRQTSRRQQHEAALAHLRYEQDCCRHAALAKEQRRQVAAVRAKAAIDKATKQLR